ncbi:hypothetical protein ACFVVM_01270 [Nocardia sp. NPDC058176]|uniref:hypothetical protein n=1 Tax=Nocardia sp. NPDC058176 TaxID=3346368 RepID=UPI0036DA5255
MVDFAFTVRDNPPEDGYSLGDLDVSGSAGSVTTRGLEAPDQRMMVYPSAADLLSEVRLLASRGKGGGRFEGIGSMFVVRFSLQKGVVETWHEKMLIDSTPLPDFLRSTLSSAKSLYRHGTGAVEANRNVLNMLAERIDSFENWQALLNIEDAKSRGGEAVEIENSDRMSSSRTAELPDLLADVIKTRSFAGLEVGSLVVDFDHVFTGGEFVEDIDKRQTTMRRDYGIVEPGFARDPDSGWRCFSLNLSVHRLRWGVRLPSSLSIDDRLPVVVSMTELEASLAVQGESLSVHGAQFHDFRHYASISGARVTVAAEDFDDLLLEGSVWSIEL